MAEHVVIATEQSFEEDVVKRSASVLVLVDFWAPWCGPCRMLTPTLESLAAEGGGRWILAKVNTDENQRLAQRFGVRGIPNVKAFRDGKVVDEFVGALPKPQVRAFIEKLLPNATDARLKRAQTLAATGESARAQSEYEAILAQEPGHNGARLALAALLLDTGDGKGALKLLDSIAEVGPHGEEARRLKARARFVDAGQGDEASGADAMAVGYASARRLARKGDWEAAADALLALLAHDRRYAGGAAKEDLLAIFTIMGDQDPRTQQLRNRLGSLLFA